MKKLLLLFFLLPVLPNIEASSNDHIRNYKSVVDFLFSSPVSFQNGLLGYINPAQINTLYSPEAIFMISTERGSVDRWGIFSGLPHLGFGMVHYDSYALSDKENPVTDYHITIGMGNENFGLGIGRAWSKRSDSKNSRDDVWTFGILMRPSSHISMGMASSFSQHYRDKQGLFELALRPLGSPLITLFGSLSVEYGRRIGDTYWSAGAVFQPAAGINIAARYLNGSTFTAGVSLNFGRCGVITATRLTKKNGFRGSTYGMRLGAARPNIIDKHILKRKRYLSLELNGEIAYQRYRLFDSHTLTLNQILTTLQNAITDPRISAVAINLSGMECSREFAWEIRTQLKRVRRSNKHVIIYIDRADMTTYHLASVADCIIIDPEGMIIIPGYIAGRTYFKGMLDKLGLGFEEWRYFKYKSAFEDYSRKDMSEPDRIQRRELVQNFYDLFLKDVSRDRNLTTKSLDSLINSTAAFMACDGVQTGLVDTIGRWSDIDKIIKSFEGRKISRLSPDHLMGRLYPPETWGNSPKIAVVYATGICAMDEGIRARELEKIILNLCRDRSIRAVVLRVDSPGGDGLASDIVAEAVRKCSDVKPLIVSQGSVAASGGYWLSMYGDTIVAAPNTITGSIGVIGGWIWNKGLGDKLGMTTDHVKAGKHADLMFGISLPFTDLYLPERNLNEDEKKIVKRSILISYRSFVKKVAAARKMSIDSVEAIAKGRVWSGIYGKSIGLVDCMGGLMKAVELAKGAAGIPKSAEIEIVELPKKGLFNPMIFLPKIPEFSFMRLKADWTWNYIRMIAKHPGQPLYCIHPDFLIE